MESTSFVSKKEEEEFKRKKIHTRSTKESLNENVG